mgnify:FL=1|tara:strand:+ start:579 stop:1739 length:1161 start_codon:yes stop_codon:yes gene_type:complete
MASFPNKLNKKLEERVSNNALRLLRMPNNLVDFSSNDYLGFAKNSSIFGNTSRILADKNSEQNGATGSRLISGNHGLYPELEKFISEFHRAESALVFNSGYDANIGFFSAVPQRGDVIFYDEYIHASIRDGIALSAAKGYKFKHNDLNNLKKVMNRVSATAIESSEVQVYVVTESIFSMDGDTPDLKLFAEYCDKSHCHLIVDEAHAIGVFGENGEGLITELQLEHLVFARIITFGKAMGCHGAAILGSQKLKDYLINFARSFIYTTGLPPHSLATINAAYHQLSLDDSQLQLQLNISYFNAQLESLDLTSVFIPSHSAIHCCLISGNEKVKGVALQLQNKGFDVRAILSPTVPIGEERLRFCIHSYNTKEEIQKVLSALKILIAK